jgi:hypothetical protein
MPIRMYWYNAEKTIFMAEYTGKWGWEELFAARDEANREFDQVEHTVDVIHDWRHSADFPPNILGQARNLIPRMHPRTGINVLVGTSPLFLALWRVLSSAYSVMVRRQRFFMVATMEEAFAIIQKERDEASRDA